MRTAWPDDGRKLKLGSELAQRKIRRRHVGQLRARRPKRCRDVEPFDPAQEVMELVAIQIANQMRRVQHRTWPAWRHLIDDPESVSAFLGIRSDHYCNIMSGHRERHVYSRNDVKRQQLDSGFFQQELDRRVAAHVDRSRECKNAQFWYRRDAWRSKQLVESDHLGLNGKSGLLVPQ